MKSPSLIHTSWLKPFADYFAKRGIDPRPYLDGAKIEHQQVNSGESWITKPQLYCFLNAVADGEQLPELGFLVGEHITPYSVRGLAEPLGKARTLGEAIRIFCQLINRSSEENQSWLKEGEEGTVWLLNRTENPFRADRRIADHAGLMTLINLVRSVGGHDWYPDKVALQTGPTSAWQELEQLRSWDIRFDQPATAVCFPAEWLIAPIREKARTPKAAGSGTGLLSDEESAVAKHQRLVREILGVGGVAPTASLMAELCGTSPRSLHRFLAANGTSYRKLLDEVRVEWATTRLLNSSVSIKELAFDLGYAGANNFVRAFRRMVGTTPTAYRRANYRGDTNPV